MFAQYLEYYAIMLTGAVFLWTQCILLSCQFAFTAVISTVYLYPTFKRSLCIMVVRPQLAL